MTDAAQITRNNCIDASRPHDQYLINWGNERDKDVFTSEMILGAIKGNEAIALGTQRTERLFDSIGKKIDDWVKENKNVISRCWMTEREGALLLIVIASGKKYNESLHDSLINLASEINTAMGDDPFRIRTLLLPGIGERPESAFLSHKMRCQIYEAPKPT